MASKSLLFMLFVIFAAVFLTSVNNASATELSEETQEKKVNNDPASVKDEKYDGYPGGGYGGYPGGGYGGYPGGGYGGYPGRGGYGGYPGRGGYGGYPGRGGYCRYGCCRRGYYGGCRCCYGPNDIPEPMYQPEVHH